MAGEMGPVAGQGTQAGGALAGGSMAAVDMGVEPVPDQGVSGDSGAPDGAVQSLDASMDIDMAVVDAHVSPVDATVNLDMILPADLGVEPDAALDPDAAIAIDAELPDAGQMGADGGAEACVDPLNYLEQVAWASVF